MSGRRGSPRSRLPCGMPTRFFVSLLLIGLGIGCEGEFPHLGGQEGEPVDSSPASDAEDGYCEVVAHCLGDGWCIDMSATSVEELTCDGRWGEGPCVAEGAIGTCPGGTDLCTVVWLYEPGVDAICAEL